MPSIIENEIDPDSLNPVTGAAVAKAVASASGEVPVIGNSDNGKVLTAVVDGTDKHVEWGDGPVNDVVAGENNSLVVKGRTNLNYKITGNGPMRFGNLEYGYYKEFDGGGGYSQLLLVYPNPSKTSLSARGDNSAPATLSIATPFTVEYDDVTGPVLIGVGYAPNDGVINDTSFPTASPWQGTIITSNAGVATFSGSCTFLGENGWPQQFGDYVVIFFNNIRTDAQRDAIIEAARSGNLTLNWPTGYTSQNADLVCASAPTGSDQNKVLTVTNSSGDLGWRDVPKELPASLGTAGQVLAVNAGATGVEWTNPPAYNPAVYDYGSDESTFMTALLANWDAGKPMMLRVPVSSFSTLTSGRQFRTGGYLFLPLVDVIGNGLTITATFALTDGLEIFSAKFVIDEDVPEWEGVHSELDQ